LVFKSIHKPAILPTVKQRTENTPIPKWQTTQLVQDGMSFQIDLLLFYL